jgi:Ni/Fe-hydrogenase 1 B-type cytochrome subunit
MSQSNPQARRVYDPLLRLLHATIGVAIIALIVTSQLADWFEHGPYEKTLWNLHILSGYVLSAGLLTRILWSLVGPASARWKDLWHPAVWKSSLKNLRLPDAHRFGHDHIASLAASEFQTGPLAGWLGNASWLEDVLGEPHEAGFVLMLGFIGLHMAALVFHQLRGERVAQSMLTGKQYHHAENGVQHD